MKLGLLQKEVWNNTDADDCDYCDGPTFNRRHTRSCLSEVLRERLAEIMVWTRISHLVRRLREKLRNTRSE